MVTCVYTYTGGDDYYAHEKSGYVYWIEGSSERIAIVWATWNRVSFIVMACNYFSFLPSESTHRQIAAVLHCAPSKTLIAKAISHESGATFFSISSSSLTSKWIGEGEQLVRTLYRVARYRAPSVVFIDEIDSLLTARKADENEASRRMKTEFLVQLDGAGNVHAGHVLTIGATNVPNELDDAARRRFVKKLYVALPTLKDREVLMRKLFSKNTHSITDKEFAKLAKNTEGYSGADLKNFCGEAAMGPLRQIDSNVVGLTPSQLPPISYKHCRRALKATSRSVSDADLKVHLEWNEMYGSKPSSGYNYDDTESDDESEDAEDS